MANDLFNHRLVWQNSDGMYTRSILKAEWEAITYIDIDGFILPYCLYEWCFE